VLRPDSQSVGWVFPDRRLVSLIGANPSLFGCKNSLLHGIGNCPKKAAESLAFGPRIPTHKAQKSPYSPYFPVKQGI
jgi:hypothetical protein